MRSFVAGALTIAALSSCACTSGERANATDASVPVDDAAAATATQPIASTESQTLVRALRARTLQVAPSPALPTPLYEPQAAEPLLPASTVVRFDASKTGLSAIVEKSPGSVPATVSLPARAAGAFRVDAGTAGFVEVSPRDVQDVPVDVVDGYAVYLAAHGPKTAAIHRVTAEGTEDYVSFEERPADERLVYEAQVGGGIAGIRVVSDTVELLDERGTPRLRMAAPYVVTADGERVSAHVTVDGCAVDTNPAAPWGRPIVPPGASACRIEVRWSGARYPLVVDPSWTTTGNLVTGRHYHTATLLSTGYVLVAGGYSTAALASSELFDPASRTFASTGSMATARYHHPATKLDDGSVVVSGGYNPTYLGSAERYNPTAGTWSAAGSLGARAYHRSTLLANGKVLAEGGYASGGVATAYLYDPATNVWSATASMSTARYGHVAVTLANGKVLAAGGYSGSAYLSSAEVYDPATSLWSSAGAMSSTRYMPFSALLPSGKALVGGGSTGSTLSSVQLYDPTTNTWSTTGALAVARYYNEAATLAGGRVLVAGGVGASALSSAEMYDPALGTWSTEVPLSQVRQYHSLTTIGGSAAVAIGGQSTTARLNGEVYNGAQTCSSGATCTSGFCVDGYCCDAECASACDRCNEPGKEGTCRTTTAGTAGTPACSPFACDGASVTCPTTCTTNAQCEAAYRCVTGSCVPKLPTGTGCSAGTECVTGHCSDGVCCSAACAGGCDVCTAVLGAPADGTCTNVTGAGTPACTPYVCSGSASACPATCASDATCIAGYFCQGSTCVVKRVNGVSCTLANQCQSGNCVDGYCCNDTCGGACDRCNVAGALGTCSVLTAGNVGTPTCSPYRCDGSSAACPTTCTFDTDCATNFLCSGGTCIAKLAAGASCGSGTQCLSGNCVDSVCCNTACAGACDACSTAAGATTNGTCAIIAGSGSPSCAPFRCAGASAACPASCTSDTQCATGKFCSASTCIDKRAPGSACTGANQCASGFCVDGVCCSTSCVGSCDRCSVAAGAALDGTCGPISGAGSPSCSPYLCVGAGATCPTNCANDSGCVAGSFCFSGLCTIKKANGGSCTDGLQCTSGFCADGVCCSAACNGGACDRCDVAGWVGTCRIAPLSNAGAPSCSPLACDGVSSACPTTCSSDTTCATGFRCVSGACVPKLANGAACADGTVCQSGSCADGVCCASSCLGACDRCDLSGSEGTCTPVAAGTPGSTSCGAFVCNGTSTSCPTSCSNDDACAAGSFCNGSTCSTARASGTSCTRTRQCQSGFCVDGYCCANDCSGQCARCNAPGSLGICTAASGRPVGTRPACLGDGTSCGGSCDGVNVLACAFPTGATICGSKCVDGVQTHASSCDGAGQCTPTTTKLCAPYRCGSTTCLTACTSSFDCSTGATCTDGACIAGDAGTTDAGSSDAGASDTATPSDAAPEAGDDAALDTSEAIDATPEIDAGAGEATVALDQGCGCEVVGRPTRSVLGSFGLAAVAGVLARRRRARR